MFKFNGLVLITIILFYNNINLSIQQGEISTDVTLTRYYLWTRQNQNSDQELLFGNLTSIEDSFFDGSKKTKVLVHGYCDNGKTGWVLRMKDAYLGKGMYLFWITHPTRLLAALSKRDRLLKGEREGPQ